MCASALALTVMVNSVAGQVTQCVSLDSSGAQANFDNYRPSISANGRYVAFESIASNLVLGDTNQHSDVFVRDRLLGTTERVSVDSSGVQGNSDSETPSLSADGRYVAFRSYANNLVASDNNGVRDIFVRDRLLGTTERISVDSSGVEASGGSDSPSISADSRYVAFASFADNLIPGGDMNGATYSDVFVWDRLLGTTEHVSVGSAGVQGNGTSFSPSISADGRYVAFMSGANNLVPGDTSIHLKVFVRDRQLGTTELVVYCADENIVIDSQVWGSISADGRYVAFLSNAMDLVPGDTNGKRDIFVADRQLGTFERVSVDSSGAQANDYSMNAPSVSADGRFVAFLSQATNLVPGDHNGFIDVFVRDRQLGTTERISVGSAGVPANSGAFVGTVSISADGRYVTFDSGATNLVPGDTNRAPDIFVRDRAASGFASTCDAGLGGVIACPCGNPPSAPGRGCDNSSATGGAMLSAAGAAYTSMDTLVFTSSGEKPTALSVFTQGSALLNSGVVFGMGVRCASMNLKRLYTKNAVGGVCSAPIGTDPSVSARSAALGDVIAPGTSRYYYVYYRDPIVLGGCPSGSTFNTTQTGQIAWSF
jgi:Tol biopolymer transport system component